MFLRLFKGAGPGVLILIIFTLFAVWMSAFLHPSMDTYAVYEKNPMPLYGMLKLAIGNNPLAGVIFSFLLVSSMAFLLVNFNTSVVFISERTFLPSLIYILFTGLFPQFQLLNPLLPASLFLMLTVIRIIDGYHKTGIAYNFFDAGILVSTGSLFYANLIWFGILVIIGIAILRTGSLIEIVLSILGLVTPYALTFGLYYVLGKDLGSLLSLIKINIFDFRESFILTGLTITALILTAILVIWSIAYLILNMNKKKIKSRSTFSLLIWVFIISFLIYMLVPSVSVEIIWFMSIPASYFVSHYFVFVKKKLIPEILFSLLFITIVLIQIWQLKQDFI
jgi:hypothetical protein